MQERETIRLQQQLRSETGQDSSLRLRTQAEGPVQQYSLNDLFSKRY
jgi:hypothetical protein